MQEKKPPFASLKLLQMSYYIIFMFLFMSKGSTAITFTLVNRCSYTVWPGILSNAGSSALDTTGFELPPLTTRSFQARPGWSGRFWGRTGCSFDPNTGQGSCTTGDCGSDKIECSGAGAAPPATLAEFTIGAGSQDFYDVSLVDGYNLPMVVKPAGGTGDCASTGCMTDLNGMCPNELRAGDGQSCKSACEAFGSPEYCCSGAYGSPTTCRPSVYSEMFKSVCPKSYSYAYDDATSTFTCSGADYVITFCPTLTSQKSSSSRDSSSSSATTTILPPAPVTGTAEGAVDSDTPQDDIPWLPNFFSSSNFMLKPSPIICSAIVFFSHYYLIFN